MKPRPHSFWIGGGLSLFYLAANGSALGQISPDGTLPTNVMQSGNLFEITGGAQAGSNLFHSFAEFSVPAGSTAHFNNTLNIENIISRVTGGSVSNIEGIIKANGIASLFLLNPNGIIFGPNAQLDIGGSFVASTANSLKFADGTEFSATASQTPPLLTVSVPVGLQFGATPGSIINRSNASPEGATNSVGDPVGLQVQPGQTLALVGGNVVLEGGNLTAAGTEIEPGGRIELGSVAGNNLVSLMPTNQGWELGYEGVQNFQDIQLSQLTIVDASGAGGTIQVQGRRVTLTDGSQIFNATLGAEPAGDLNVITSKSVELIGTDRTGEFPSGLFSDVNERVTGSGGNLSIATRRLIVRGGGIASAGTLGDGRGGNLTVNASESVELIGVGSFDSSLLTTATLGSGRGGDLTINTRRLIVRDGAQIEASTFSEGQGGTLTVNALESVEVIGTGITEDRFEFASALLAPSGISDIKGEPTGNGGNLTIATEKLIVRDGAEVAVSSIVSGNAGNLEVTASSIFLDNQGKLTAATESGQGGNISLQGLDSLLLRRQSEISTEADGTGDGGNITINSDIIALLEESKITANAFQGRGGNIQITTQGLFVSPDSEITASSELGVDGAIEINRPEVDPKSGLVELPEEPVNVARLIDQNLCAVGQGSEFTVTGRGGLPDSPTQALSPDLAWEDLRLAQSSEQPVGSQPNTVRLEELSVVYDAAEAVETSRGSRGNRGSRGTGEERISAYPNSIESQPTAPVQTSVSTHRQTTNDSAQETIVEFQGWAINVRGNVVLTAEANTVTPQGVWLPPPGCQ